MPAANTYASPGTTGGNREDLRDILTILEPEQTPVVSAMNKGPAPKGTYTEVLADELDAPTTDGQPEGKDISQFANKAVKRQRFGNNIQIATRDFGVTDVQMLVETAAVSNEYEYAKMKTLREMKRDLESTICSNNERNQGNGTDAWKTRGLFKWTGSDRADGSGNVLANRTAPDNVPVEYRTPAAQDINAAGNLTETLLNGVLQSLFETHSAKKTYMGVFGPEVVEKIDNFTRIEPASDTRRYTINDDAAKKTINLEVKVFNSSFGRVNVIPSVFLDRSGATFNTEAGLILDLELVALQYMEGLHVVNLDDEGGGPRGYAKTIYNLMCKNPKGLAAIDNGA
tara:strand:- start:3227 stop:4252 length:1026 start_codon:yes stop_codon:yes gene_type:complete